MVGTVVATRLSHLPLNLDTESDEPPIVAVSSGWLVFGVASKLGHWWSCQCIGTGNFTVFWISGRSARSLNNSWYLDKLLDLLDDREMSLRSVLVS